jgi:hypothetical protein
MLVSCHLVLHVTTCGEYVREFASQVLNKCSSLHVYIVLYIVNNSSQVYT